VAALLPAVAHRWLIGFVGEHRCVDCTAKVALAGSESF